MRRRPAGPLALALSAARYNVVLIFHSFSPSRFRLVISEFSTETIQEVATRRGSFKRAGHGQSTKQRVKHDVTRLPKQLEGSLQVVESAADDDAGGVEGRERPHDSIRIARCFTTRSWPTTARRKKLEGRSYFRDSSRTSDLLFDLEYILDSTDSQYLIVNFKLVSDDHVKLMLSNTPQLYRLLF